MDLWRVLDRRKIGNAIPRFINDYSVSLYIHFVHSAELDEEKRREAICYRRCVKNIQRVDILPRTGKSEKLRSNHFATIAIILKTSRENNPSRIFKKKEEKYLSRTRSIFDRFPYVTMRTFLCGSDIRSDPERYRMIHVFPRYRKLGGKFMRRFAFDPSSTRGKRRESGQTVTR